VKKRSRDLLLKFGHPPNPVKTYFYQTIIILLSAAFPSL